ncbi:MAG: hypothetical protein ACM3KF_01885 [Acidobacteriota bacterium]
MGGRGYQEDLVLPAPGSDVRHHVTEPDDFADQLAHGEPDDVADSVADQQSVPDGFAHGNSHSFSDRLSDDVADSVADQQSVPDGFSDGEADHPHQAEQAR